MLLCAQALGRRYHLSVTERVFSAGCDRRRKCFLVGYVTAMASSCEFAAVRNIVEFIVTIHMTA